jgi:hypothetical protein
MAALRLGKVYPKTIPMTKRFRKEVRIYEDICPTRGNVFFWVFSDLLNGQRIFTWENATTVSNSNLSLYGSGV